MIGRRLARMLDTGPGGELLVLSQGADGSFAYDLYRVRGVLRGISDATDRTGIFMTTATFRELFVVPTGVHQIIVRRPADTELGSAESVVRGLARDLDVQTWRQLMPTVASMLDSARTAMFAAYFIIYLAIAILILNAMLMAVFERIREIGVLKAIGTGPFQVFALVLAESALQVVLAIVLGVALSIPALAYLTRVGLDMSELGGVAVIGRRHGPGVARGRDHGVVHAPDPGPLRNRRVRRNLSRHQGGLDPSDPGDALPVGVPHGQQHPAGPHGVAQPVAPPPTVADHGLLDRARRHARGPDDGAAERQLARHDRPGRAHGGRSRRPPAPRVPGHADPVPQPAGHRRPARDRAPPIPRWSAPSTASRAR